MYPSPMAYRDTLSAARHTHGTTMGLHQQVLRGGLSSGVGTDTYFHAVRMSRMDTRLAADAALKAEALSMVHLLGVDIACERADGACPSAPIRPAPRSAFGRQETILDGRSPKRLGQRRGRSFIHPTQSGRKILYSQLTTRS